MTMRRTIPAAALLLAACAGSTPAPEQPEGGQARDPQRTAEAVLPVGARQMPPVPLPPTPVQFPAFQERTLDNGARVIVVENHEQPAVTVNLQLLSGTAADPAGKVGVAALTAAMLEKGTRTRTAEQIAGTVDFFGGQISAGASDEWSSVVAVATTEALDTILAVFSDVVQNPTFPAEAFETERGRMLGGLQVELSQPSVVAGRRIAQEVFGEHPYGKVQTQATLEAIGREDLAAFHRAHYRPNNALFVVAGDVDPDAVVAQLNRRFAGWQPGEVARPARTPAPARAAREIVLVHKPGSAQTVIRAGHAIAPATDPDWVALDVALQALGGGSSGWLFQVLREQKGYTYGAYASAARQPDPGLFQVSAEVRNEVADSAMAELFRLLGKLTGEPLPAADLALARSYITGRFPRDIETPQQVASQVASNRLLGRPDDYLTTYRTRVAAMGADEVQRVAAEHIHPERAVVVVVGDALALREKLAPFGPVRVVDEQGRPVELPEPGAAPAPSAALDASALQPGSLTRVILFQGQPVAEITSTVTRETVEGREAVRVVTTSTGMIGQSGDLAFDARDFTPIYSEFEQVQGPMKVTMELRFADGRVTGSASGPQGERSFDAQAPAGTLLSGMDEFAISVLPLAPGKEFTLQVFNAMTGAVSPITVEVVGETTVATQAGEFEVFEVETTGGAAPMKLFVRKAAPHVLVRQEITGQPVVVELKAVK